LRMISEDCKPVLIGPQVADHATVIQATQWGDAKQTKIALVATVHYLARVNQTPGGSRGGSVGHYPLVPHSRFRAESCAPRRN
jgi:hypothetical protein